jgi:hypothetical protein
MEDTGKTFGAGYVTLVPDCITTGIPVTCWTSTECAGQYMGGDATCDGQVNLADLTKLKLSWGRDDVNDPHGQAAGQYNCCADFTQDGVVNLADLTKLKLAWGTTGITPSTLNQTCP